MRRLLLIVTLVSVALAGLSACGGDSGSTGAIDGVTVTGDFGAEPQVSVDGLDQTLTESATLIEGDGAEAEADDQVFVQIFLANGNTGDKAASTWDQGQAAQIALSSESGLPGLVDALVGQKAGSRVLFVAPAADIWEGTGNPQIGLNPDDAAVFVVDLITVLIDGPDGAKQDVASDLPVPVEVDGKVTGIDFSMAPTKPTDKLQVITLVEGDGEPVAKGSLVGFNYFGVIYGGTVAFDESYSRGPAAFKVGVGSLIKAWDQGLVGVPTGSRVLIISPPDFGYGDDGSDTIPGGSTLVFVVDVLGVA